MTTMGRSRARVSPNRAAVMNSLPAESRGVGVGMNQTFQNSAQVISNGLLGPSGLFPDVPQCGLEFHL